jgi:hypothetical protein
MPWPTSQRAYAHRRQGGALPGPLKPRFEPVPRWSRPFLRMSDISPISREVILSWNAKGSWQSGAKAFPTAPVDRTPLRLARPSLADSTQPAAPGCQGSATRDYRMASTPVELAETP